MLVLSFVQHVFPSYQSLGTEQEAKKIQPPSSEASLLTQTLLLPRTHAAAAATILFSPCLLSRDLPQPQGSLGSVNEQVAHEEEETGVIIS